MDRFYISYDKIESQPIQVAGCESPPVFQSDLRRTAAKRSMARVQIDCFAINCQAMDNGPEYISATLQVWAAQRGIELMYIQPGKPQQNAYVERYNRTVRQEWLGQYLFDTLEQVQEHATRWLWSYNNERPNMGIGGITPAQKLKQAA